MNDVATSLQHLDFIIRNSDSVIKVVETTEFPESLEDNRIQFSGTLLLQRLNFACRGLNVLLKSLTEDPALEYTAVLTARTVFLDFLIGLKAYSIYTDAESEGLPRESIRRQVFNFCNGALAEGFKFSLSYLIDLEAAGTISQPKLCRTFFSLTNQYSPFFQPYKFDGKKPILSVDAKPLQASQIFKELKKHPALAHLASKYDTYLLFSKYEHYGIEFYTIMHDNQTEKLSRLLKAIELFPMHYFLTMHLIGAYSDNNMRIDEMYVESGEYIKRMGLAK